jgi:transposase-like protein
MRDPQKGVQVQEATPQYPPEFKAKAIRLVRSSGRSIPQVDKELGDSDNFLRNRQAEDGDLRVPGGFPQPHEDPFLTRLKEPRRL